ncbi:Calcyclin-binding protein [Halotydeus destructor]|nr:Calcyclin-binding protein [Halotydeus destructor]
MSLKTQAESIAADITELEMLISKSTRDSVKQLLKGEVNNLSLKKMNLEKEISRSSNPVADQVASLRTVSTFAWDQTKEFVKIYIDLAGEAVEENQIKMDLSKRSVLVIFGNRKFILTKLNKDIDGSKSYFKITKSKIIVYLKKEKETDWPGIKDIEGAYKKHVEEEKDDLGDDPSGGLMKLMKKMYDEGDDEMKRTIAKSWSESQNKKDGGLAGLDM